jgi:hypothetical protein
MYAKVSMKALNLATPMNVTAAVAEKVLEYDSVGCFWMQLDQLDCRR